MKLNTRQVGEFECRAFLGDETWKRWKTDFDNCMAFRKTLKGKPTAEERLILEMNNAFIDFYGAVLFHTTRGNCDCAKCGKNRSIK